MTPTSLPKSRTRKAPLRRGGRLARLADRKDSMAGEHTVVVPGYAGEAYRPLRESQLEAIFETALSLLSEIGVGQPTPEIIERVTKAGGSLDETSRLRFPRALVRHTLKVARKSWTQPGQSDARSLAIDPGRVYLGTSGAAVLIWEPERNDFAESTLVHLHQMTRLADQLDHIHFFIRPLVTRDMPNSRDLDLNTAYAVATGTDKVVGTSHFLPEHVPETLALCDTLLGGRGDGAAFAERPFMIVNNTFVVPPLRFAEDACLCLAEQVRCGFTINLVSAGQAGATSPASLAGTLAQALAECLAGLVFINLIREGHPTFLGLWPFVSDLRSGAMSGGSGEEALLGAAAAQLCNWLGIPMSTAAGMTDSKMLDTQAGYEKGITAVLAAQAGATFVCEAAGMLASLLVTSNEVLVVDNDMLGMINRTLRGIEVDEKSMALESFRNVVHGEGHFLGAGQTLERMQREYLYPDLADRTSPKEWLENEKPILVQKAQERVQELLDVPPGGHLDKAADARVRERFPIALPRDAVFPA